MKVSKTQVDENRRAILAAAGRLFRQRGFEAVTVAEVMAAAGLTHGAFYGYFRSKEELVAATLAELLTAPRPPGKRAQRAARYLSPGHRADSAGGCPVAALATDAGRGSRQARAAMAAGVERMIASETADIPGGSDEVRRLEAVGRVAAMVGALILSRAIGEGGLSDEVLAATRAWLDAEGEPQTLDG
jgi:TetR/AcrR family transcriptional repressor of nem operon